MTAPSIFTVFFVSTTIASFIVTASVWGTTYRSGLENAKKLGDIALEEFTDYSAQTVRNELDIQFRSVRQAIRDVQLGVIYPNFTTERSEHERSIRYLGGLLDVLNSNSTGYRQNREPPLFSYASLMDLRRGNHSAPWKYWFGDAVHYIPAFHGFKPLQSIQPIPGGTCQDGTYFDVDDSWNIKWDTMLVNLTCLNLELWPGVAALYSPSLSISFGPYLPSDMVDMQLGYAQATILDNGKRAVIMGIGFVLTALSDRLRVEKKFFDAAMLVVDNTFNIVATSTGESPIELTPGTGSHPWIAWQRLHVSDLKNKDFAKALNMTAASYGFSTLSITKKVMKRVDIGGVNGTFVVSVRPLDDGIHDWYVIQIASESPISSLIMDGLRVAIALWVVIGLLYAVFLLFSAFFMAHPLRILTRGMDALSRLDFAETQENVDILQNPCMKLEETLRLERSFQTVLNAHHKYFTLQREALNQQAISIDRIAGVSHEIRTPLQGIFGIAELGVAASELPSLEQYKADMATIQTVGESLLMVLNDMVDIGRLEQGKLSLVPKLTDLNAVIQHVVSLFGPRMREKGLQLTAHVDDDVDPIITDPHRLTQVLTNFASNAFKFCDKGSVSITCHTLDPSTNGSDVAISLTDEQPMVRIEISDTGIGIKEENAGKLFQKYSQVHERGTAGETWRAPGSGLGLSLTRRLAELMGGKVGVKSEYGVGSQFWLDLPYARQDGTLPAVSPGSKSVTSSVSLSDIRVLAVDDNNINRMVVRQMCLHVGMSCKSVSDGQQCIDELVHARASGNEYHIVLCDLDMPVLDGWGTVDAIRSDLKMQIPVLALTGAVSNDINEKCIEAGFSGFLAKPITKKRLIEVVNVYCSEQNLSNSEFGLTTGK